VNKSKKYILIGSAIFMDFLAGCGTEGVADETNAPATEIGVKSLAIKSDQNDEQGITTAPTDEASVDTGEISSVPGSVEQGAPAEGFLANCYGWAGTPYYDGSNTVAKGYVNCTSRDTITAYVCLERINGSLVGCTSTLSCTFSGTCTYSASWSGCRSDTSYRTHFVSNGVSHYSPYKKGCSR
jgi:hypothetical protein